MPSFTHTQQWLNTETLQWIIKLERLDATLTEMMRAHEQRMGRMEQHIDLLATRRSKKTDWLLMAKLTAFTVLMGLGSTGIITWPQVQAIAQSIGTP